MPVSTHVNHDRYGFGRYESRWYPGAEVISFTEAIRRRGLKDPGKRCVKPRVSTAKPARDYPSPNWVQHLLLIQIQSPIAGVTVNEDGEFSSRSLTDEYVREYSNRNHLRA